MDTRRLLPLAVVLSAAVASCGAAPAQLWSVGATDRSGKEFALSREYSRFPKEIPEPFRYRIGQDQPGKWPFIHPGPEDEWAGKRRHPLTLSFDLPAAPQGEVALVVDTVGNHAHPLVLEAAINGTTVTAELPAGGGDRSLKDESAGTPRSTRFSFHPSVFQAGANEITLTVRSGSWLLYDSIRLENNPEKQVPLLEARAVSSPPLFVRSGDGLAQIVRLEAANTGRATTGQLSAECGGKHYSTAVTLISGDNRLDLPVAEVSVPTSVTLTLAANGESVSREGTLLPQKKWTVFAVPSIHTDIGYTHTQEEVFKRHNDNLDAVAELCRKHPDFKWNIEVVWELQNYRNDRPATATQALLDLLHSNRIGLHAGYLNMLTSLMTDEAMNRYIYYAADYHRKYGLDTSSAVLTDVPSAGWSLTSALAGSGVKYFAEGCNQDRGPILRNRELANPFYWEGPDGSRVLTLLNHTYAQSRWLAEVDTLGDMEQRLNGLIRGFDRPGYPYDAIYLYGAFWDNEAIGTRYGHLLNAWKSAYEYPKVVMATGPEFFQYLEKKYGERIPVRRADFGAYWEDGAGSTSHETMLHEHNQRRMVAAETIRAMARMAGSDIQPELESFVRSWQQILFYIEHTWGAAQSISDPDSPASRAQWSTKSEYAHKPDAESRRLLADGLKAYAATVAAGKGDLVVANTLSWERGGVVELPENLPAGVSFRDGEGKAVPLQEESGKRFISVTGIPAFGSQVYQVQPGGATEEQAGGKDASPASLENEFYRIMLDPARGVRSIVDKASGRELLDPASRYSFGQLVYACGGEGTSMVHESSTVQPEFRYLERESGESLAPPERTVVVTPATVTGVRGGGRGALWQEAVIDSTAPSMPQVRTSVRLFNQEKRIEVDVQITSKTEVRRKEAVYIAFPLAGRDPRFRLGLSSAVADPAKDFAPGGCHEWYCAQDFVSCTPADGGPEVVITPLDSPLLTLSDINRGRWPLTPELTTATVYSYPMNNYWHTNYKAGQGGDFRYRYEITSGKEELATDEARLRFSRTAVQPLLAAVSEGGQESKRASKVAVEGRGVMAITLKAAEVGEGYILRLRNTEGTSTTATIHLPEAGSGEVERLDLVENSQEKLRAEEGKVTVSLRPQQTATLRIPKP